MRQRLHARALARRCARLRAHCARACRYLPRWGMRKHPNEGQVRGGAVLGDDHDDDAGLRRHIPRDAPRARLRHLRGPHQRPRLLLLHGKRRGAHLPGATIEPCKVAHGALAGHGQGAGQERPLVRCGGACARVGSLVHAWCVALVSASNRRPAVRARVPQVPGLEDRYQDKLRSVAEYLQVLARKRWGSPCVRRTASTVLGNDRD